MGTTTAPGVGQSLLEDQLLSTDATMRDASHLSPPKPEKKSEPVKKSTKAPQLPSALDDRLRGATKAGLRALGDSREAKGIIQTKGLFKVGITSATKESRFQRMRAKLA